MSIALKETRETDYWLSILQDTSQIEEEQCGILRKDCQELVAMLVATVKTSKQ